MIMKKIFGFFLLIAFATPVFIGCKGKDSVANDPKTVLTTFFERMSKKDIDGAAKLATKDSKGTLDMMKKGMEAAEKMKGMGGAEEKDPTEDFKKMTFGDAKIEGDKATVSVTNPAKGKEPFEFPLVKEGGEWKVDFSMSTLMKMGMNQAGDSDNFPSTNGDQTDSTGNNIDLDKLPSMDSLTDAMEKAKDMLKNIKPEDLEKAKELMKELEKAKQQ